MWNSVALSNWRENVFNIWDLKQPNTNKDIPGKVFRGEFSLLFLLYETETYWWPSQKPVREFFAKIVIVFSQEDPS